MVVYPATKLVLRLWVVRFENLILEQVNIPQLIIFVILICHLSGGQYVLCV